jgi:membrane protein implicated in regulation of membrane protease activity
MTPAAAVGTVKRSGVNWLRRRVHDSRSSAGSADDGGSGLVMLVVFAAAALVVTGAVAILALAGSWWMPAAAFGVHVVMTSVVTASVFNALNGGSVALRSGADRGAGEASERELPVRGRATLGRSSAARPEGSRTQTRLGRRLLHLD